MTASRMKTKVKDQAPEYHWWTRLPNIVLERIETPYQLTLLFVYKKIAAEAGECWFTMEKIAEMAKMSMGKASQTRRGLEKLGLIKVELRKPKKSRGRPCCHVTVVNIWEENEAEWRRICAERERRLVPEEIFSSPHEEIEEIPASSSPHEGYPSPREATKNKEEDIPSLYREGKSPPASTSDHKRLMALYREAIREDEGKKKGKELTAPGKENKAAEEILEMGFTAEEAIDCYHHFKAESFWRGKHLSLAYIVEHIGAWRESKGEASRRVPGKQGVSQAQRDYYAAHLDPKD